MRDETRMTLLHSSTNDLVEELLMWRGLAAEHLDRIAELEAAQRWIPVSERLPEADGYYWTMDFFKQEQKYKYRQKKWYDQSGMAVEFSATHVTHWMPLPKLPEVQE